MTDQPNLFHDSKSGDVMWRCLRCRGEHSMLGEAPCHQIQVGAGGVVGFCCSDCLDVVKDEIRALLPLPGCSAQAPRVEQATEREAGFYWVDFGWESGPLVAQWLTAAQVVARYAGTGWKLPPGVKPIGHWELPSDEAMQPEGISAQVISERLQSPAGAGPRKATSQL